MTTDVVLMEMYRSPFESLRVFAHLRPQKATPFRAQNPRTPTWYGDNTMQTLDRCFRSVIFLNNTAITLLKRGYYQEAIHTLRSAIATMNLILLDATRAEASVMKNLKAATHNLSAICSPQEMLPSNILDYEASSPDLVQKLLTLRQSDDRNETLLGDRQLKVVLRMDPEIASVPGFSSAILVYNLAVANKCHRRSIEDSMDQRVNGLFGLCQTLLRLDECERLDSLMDGRLAVFMLTLHQQTDADAALRLFELLDWCHGILPKLEHFAGPTRNAPAA